MPSAKRQCEGAHDPLRAGEAKVGEEVPDGDARPADSGFLHCAWVSTATSSKNCVHIMRADREGDPTQLAHVRDHVVAEGNRHLNHQARDDSVSCS